MRTDEFFAEDPFGEIDEPNNRALNHSLLTGLRRGALADRTDVEVAVPLARLVHDNLEEYGTSGNQELSGEEIREALLALRAVMQRLGLEDPHLPFRDYSSFRSYWLREGASGSWQARRVILEGLLGPVHDELIALELGSITSTLVKPVSPRARTGWPKVDEELSELRRHFQTARTAQDYRAVGNDCVFVLEALSRHVYKPELHLRDGESEPPVASTKLRLDRYVEVALPGTGSKELRKVAKAVIELAQAVKHSTTPSRTEAGIAADAVIQLANLMRRLEDPPA